LFLLLILSLLKTFYVTRTFGGDEIPYGPWVDEIEFSKVGTESEALQLLEQNEAQAYLSRISPDLYQQFKDSPNLEYRVFHGVYFELTFNPVGPEFNDGRFNPFSNRRIREAMNYLVNRTHIAKDICLGMANPKFVPFISTFPEYERLIDAIKPLEVKYEYNFSKAREIMFDELVKMGACYENSEGRWYYRGEPIVIKLIIRIEDERLEIGNYVADQLERLGFTVERMYKTLSEARPIWMYSDPAEGGWHIYTGGWITTMVTRDDSGNFQFFYSPKSSMASISPLWAAYMPSPEFSEIADRLAEGDWQTWEERMELMRQALPLCLEDSVRIWLVDALSPVVFRKEIDVVLDLSGGFFGSIWPRTIRYEQGAGGMVKVMDKEVLVDPWNPVVRSGWAYDLSIMGCADDAAAIYHPYNGLPMPNRFINATVILEESEEERVISSSDWLTLNFANSIPVPPDAWYDWDVQEKKVIYAPEGTFSKAKIVINYSYPIGTVKYHDGSVMTLADWVAMWPLKFERANPASPLFDESYLGEFESFRRNFMGMRIVSESPLVIEYYTNYTQREAEFIVSYVAEWPTMPWHAVALGVKAEEEGRLAFSSSKASARGVPWMSYISGDSLPILEEELLDAMSSRYRPLLAGEYVSEEGAEARYGNLANWYSVHNHFWVSSGPFYLESADYAADRAVLKAFRDYTYKADRWAWLSQPAENQRLIITACSPVHLFVTDELGRSVGFNPETGLIINEIPGATYSGPREEGEVIYIPGPSGTYRIKLVGISEGAYTLRIEWMNIATGQSTLETFTGEITAGTIDEYRTGVSETGASTLVVATLEVEPDVLNPKSKGKFITAYIELPAGLHPEDIDINTVRIGPVPAVTDPSYSFVTNPEEYMVDHDGDGVMERMVKFDRQAIINYLEELSAELGKRRITLSLTGYVSGKLFEGSDDVELLGG
jgi:peptide/nickel transport system substrate-binding protein